MSGQDSTPRGAEPARAAIWARVSTEDQDTASQLAVLREWARKRGFEVVREFITEDSAWQHGNGAKGKVFDAQRSELIRGARHGDYTRILIWSLDRLSRRGIKDTASILEDLDDVGVITCSYRQDWLETTDPRTRKLIVSVMSWLAEIYSADLSAAIRRGMGERKAAGKPVGGRKAGSRDKRRRSGEGYEAAWEPGGTLYQARQERLAAAKAELLADPVRLREMRRDVPCDECGAAIADPCRRTKGKGKGLALGVRDTHTSRQEASDRAAQVAQVSAIVSEAAESAANSTGSEEQ